MAEKRNRRLLKCPVKILTDFGVSAGLVNDDSTHLHYDHSGNFDQFFNAQFHLQEQEIHATGQYMRYAHLNHTFEVDDICGIIRLNYQQRVTLITVTKLSSGIDSSYWGSFRRITVCVNLHQTWLGHFSVGC